jgi:hypothetical protein
MRSTTFENVGARGEPGRSKLCRRATPPVWCAAALAPGGERVAWREALAVLESRWPAWCQGNDQGQAIAVHQGVGLGRQATSRAPDAVIVRFDPATARIRVIRWCPPCARWVRRLTRQLSRRAGEPGRSWSRPTAANRCLLWRPPAPATPSVPGTRLWTRHCRRARLPARQTWPHRGRALASRHHVLRPDGRTIH